TTLSRIAELSVQALRPATLSIRAQPSLRSGQLHLPPWTIPADGNEPTIDHVTHAPAAEVPQRELVGALGRAVQVHPRCLATSGSGSTVAGRRTVPQGLLRRDEDVLDPIAIEVTRLQPVVGRSTHQVIRDPRCALGMLNGVIWVGMRKNIEANDGAVG